MLKLYVSVPVAFVISSHIAQAYPADVKVRPSSSGILSKADGPSFEVDGSVADKIFQANTKSDEKSSPSLQVVGMKVATGFQQTFFSEVETTNPYFDFDLDNEVVSSVGGQIALGKTLYASPVLPAEVIVKGSYLYAQGVFGVESKNAKIAAKDEIEVTIWSLGSELRQYWRSGFSVDPFIGAGGSFLRITQSGQLDGFSRSYSTETLDLTVGVDLFATSPGQAGFSGVQLAAQHQRGFRSNPKYQATNTQVGIGYSF